MNSNLKQVQKTINNSQSATFIPWNESKGQSPFLEQEQSLINVSGLDGGKEKLSNQQLDLSRSLFYNCGPSFGLEKEDLSGKMTRVQQEKKTQTTKMRDENLSDIRQGRERIVEESRIANEEVDRRGDDNLAYRKQTEQIQEMGKYNKVVNNKQGKQINQQYINRNHNNKQRGQVLSENIKINSVQKGDDIVESESRDGREMSYGDDVNVKKRVHIGDGNKVNGYLRQVNGSVSGSSGICRESQIGGSNKNQIDLEISSAYNGNIKTSGINKRLPHSSNISSMLMNNGSVFKGNSQLMNYTNSTSFISNNNSNGLSWNNMNIGNSNLSLISNSNSQLSRDTNGNKSYMYESNNNHHMGYLLGGLFDNSRMNSRNNTTVGSSNMVNMNNSNNSMRRPSTNSNIPTSTLFSSGKYPSAAPSINYQPIYNKQPKLVMNSSNTNTKIINKQQPNNNTYLNAPINTSINNNDTNNNINNANLNNNQNVLIQQKQSKSTTQDPFQQTRAIVYANKDKKYIQPQVIVLDSDDQQLQQQHKPNDKIDQFKQPLNTIQTPHTQHNNMQQSNMTKVSQVQQNNEIKTPQMPMSMPSAHLYSSTAKSLVQYNNSQQQYNNYLSNYLSKQLLYSQNNRSMPYQSMNNHLHYDSYLDYYSQPSSISNRSSVNYSGKQYKQHLSQKNYDKTKQIYKQHQHHNDIHYQRQINMNRATGVYGDINNMDRIRQLSRQQNKGMGSFLSSQGYYSQYNQYPNMIKPQPQPNYQNNYNIINPNSSYSINNNTNNSNKYPISTSISFKSSLTQQKQLDIINNLDKLKANYDNFYKDNQLPFSNNLHSNINNKVPSIQNKDKNKDKSKNKIDLIKPPKKRNSFYLNSLRQVEAKKLLLQQQQQSNNNNLQQQNSNIKLQQQNINNNNNQSQQQNNINPPQITNNKQFQGTDHVKRQAQKAFLKTRSRINSQYPTTTKSVQNESNIKKLSKKERIANREIDKSTISQLSTNVQEKEKYTFQWTPRLKKLRQVTKKRDYDSVILIGPDFQANIPTFMTDLRQIRTVIGVKRANLLRRMFKYSSEIGEKPAIY